MKVADLKLKVEELRNQNQQRYVIAMNKEGYDKLDKQPTVDADGRYHAPCDNYTWVDGEMYLGGQYLPDPYADKFDIYKSSKTQTYKIKVAVDAIPELSMFLFGSNGKSWVENSIEVCYYYASVSKSEFKLLASLLPNENSKKVVLVSEYGNPTNQKTWKFSSKKVWRKFVDMYIDMDILAPGVDIKIDDKGNAYSDFDKKEVRYEYFKPEILTL